MSTEPLSLYLDLEQDTKADLEVVANASLALASMLKEIAHIIDPSIDISIELDSGTSGSLSLNTLINIVKERVLPGKLSLKASAIPSFFTQPRMFE
jgi:hypothetical protein